MAIVEFPRMTGGVRFHVPREPEARDVICLVDGLSFMVRREVHDRLIPLLTGERSRAQLIAQCAGQLNATEVLAALHWLARHRAIDDVRAKGPWRVAVRWIGLPEDESLDAALAGAGLRRVAEAEAQLTIIVAAHYLSEELDHYNRQASGAWMLVRPDANLWLGPIFQPGRSACWECLAQRLRFNGRIDQYLASATGKRAQYQQSDRVRPERQTLFALAVQAARRYLETGKSPLVNALVSLKSESLETSRHRLIHRPQCSVCGQPPSPSDKPPRLVDPDDWSESNADKDAQARATLREFEYHISPVTGLLPGLTSQSQLRDIHVYSGGAYTTRTPENWRALEQSLSFRGAGKGLSEDIAKAGALAETLEWYTLGAQDHRLAINGTFANLSQRERAIPPPQLASFSADQYAHRETTNRAAATNKYMIPEPFDAKVSFDWVKLWSLSRGEWVQLPGAAVANSYKCPFMRHNPNGSAAGRSLTEAAVHATLELVERDAIALWWYNYAARPAMPLSHACTDLVRAMNREYARIGRRFWVLDVTTDLGIPVAAAISVGIGETVEELVMGFGAHFDPAVAMNRALTEMNQLQKKLVEVVPRDDRPRDQGGGADRLPPHIWPMGEASAGPSTAPREIASASPRKQIDWLLVNFGKHDLEMIVGDLTLPDVALPVARVVVPGLRAAYPQFGPGRIHDIPLTLGWISAPTPTTRMRLLPSPL